jgi:hypothetical protein
MSITTRPAALWESLTVDESNNLILNLATSELPRQIVVIPLAVTTSVFGPHDDQVAFGRSHFREIETAIGRAWHPDRLRELIGVGHPGHILQLWLDTDDFARPNWVGRVADLPDQKQLWDAYGHAMGAAGGLELLMRIALINDAAQRLAQEGLVDQNSRTKALEEIQGMTFGRTVRRFKQVFPNLAEDAQFCESIDNAVSSRSLGA